MEKEDALKRNKFNFFANFMKRPCSHETILELEFFPDKKSISPPTILLKVIYITTKLSYLGGLLLAVKLDTFMDYGNPLL